MKVPLITLVDRLTKRPVGSGRDVDVMIEGIRVLNQESEKSECSSSDMFEKGMLYVSENVIRTSICPADSAVIYLCAPVDDLPYCALFAPGCNLADMTNELLGIWDCFAQDHDELFRCVFVERDLKAFVRHCSKVMRNPAYIVDSSFKVLAIDDQPMLSEMSAIWKNLVENGYLSYDIVAKLRTSRDLARMDSHDRAVLFSSDSFNNEFINYNLYTGSNVVGHFFIVGYNRAITAGDVAYANLLGKMLEPALELDRAHTSSRGKAYENFLIHMLEGTLTDPSQIKAQLAPLGWNFDGRFLVFAMQPKETDDLLISMLCSKIEQTRSGKPVFFEGAIIAIFPVSVSDDAVLIKKALEVIVGKDGGTGALSDEFEGFKRVADHYRQARVALALGTVEGGSVIRYGDCAMTHVLDTARMGMDLEMACEKAVFRLRDYDREHGSEYGKTLDTYLKNERSITITAKKLHIHRNTLMYRIGRVTEALMLDLDDYVLRQRLMFSFRIMEYLGAQEKGDVS